MVLQKRIGFLVTVAAVLSLVLSLSVQADPGRYEKELSGPGWRLKLDRDADWRSETAYLPPVDLTAIPVHVPTFGWDMLDSQPDQFVNVPGTVEEYYWSEIENQGTGGRGASGDYLGVSWWSRTFMLPPDLMGKKLTIAFESVNLCAEVYVNHQLVGYDVIGNTPFEVDATKAMVFDGPNRLDIRIVDPVGTFSWNDNPLLAWGENQVPANHGFGGITGTVVLRATDPVYVTDVYVENKPNPTDAEVFVTLANDTGRAQSGTLSLVVHEYENPDAVVYQTTVNATVPPEGLERSIAFSAPNAKLWELSPYRTVQKAALYQAKVTFTTGDQTISDGMSRRFGFRFFTVGEKDGDKRFYLNGKRVFLMAAMTRGFWPKNGIFATPEMAMRDMETLVDLGYNLMLMHRAIGQPPVIEYADEYGLLTYEEPGGYRITGSGRPTTESGAAGSEMGLRWREEKLRRMVIRDRSYPSMIIYNLKNEAEAAPDEYDVADIKMVHELDPGRIITYNSDRNRQIEYYERIENDGYKLNMRPFDDTLYYDWWDHHHWYAYPGYVDTNYQNPRYYLRGVVDGDRAPNVPEDSLYRLDPSEIIFWGEEGAWGTMLRLGAITEEFAETGVPPTGFREMEHVTWNNNWDEFLDNTGFKSTYPTVDDLTLAAGKNLHYFHARSLENIRLSNIGDAMNLNGWASASTRTDLVDMYRNPTGDPSILQYYSQPAYVAVKIRDKAIATGMVPIADFFIINEIDVKGQANLEVTFNDPNGKAVFTRTYPVNILGGEEFGQLLVEGVELPAVTMNGRYMLNARIVQNGQEKCTGHDDIYAADYTTGPGVRGTIAVLESDGVIKNFLKTARNINAVDYTVGTNASVIIVGQTDQAQALAGDILQRVAGGAKLVVLVPDATWIDAVNGAVSGVAPFTSNRTSNMSMGSYFMSTNPYFAGLPQAQSMGWEYQFFYRYGRIAGFILDPASDAECVVGCCASGSAVPAVGVARVPLGSGSVLLSNLGILDALASDLPQAAVPKKLFMNFVELSN